MRSLRLNKTKVWYVAPLAETDEVDTDGNYTGEVVKTYSEPEEIWIHIYPAVGNIATQLFGLDESPDMVAVTTDLILDKEGLLFLTEPGEDVDYYDTYDYSVSSILTSLNTTRYGLRGRING